MNIGWNISKLTAKIILSFLVVYKLSLAQETVAPNNATPTTVVEREYEEIPGVVVRIVELKRTANNTVTLRWAYRNTSSDVVELHGSGYAYDLGRDHYLLDMVNRKQYFAIEQNGDPLGRRHGEVMLDPGKEYVMWLRFPAPPNNVDKIDVYIKYTSEPFEAVQITK
ncbi:MAG TPA: hypothetical protein PKC68_02985 [Alphaproteobacteria bacterium]|jgi:hypothetical protein|nr:hypothetical protein [Alphaproteobacteria bacterium]